MVGTIKKLHIAKLKLAENSDIAEIEGEISPAEPQKNKIGLNKTHKWSSLERAGIGGDNGYGYRLLQRNRKSGGP